VTGFDLAAVFLLIVGVAGWLNVRYLRLPTATVMVIAGLASGGILLLMMRLAPQSSTPVELTRLIAQLDFPRTVLGYMLGFLLFAGAMQVSLEQLRREIWAIFSLATLGVLASAAIVGLGLSAAAQVLGLYLPLSWAIVFGALISPTDPIAVLAAVKQGNLSKTLEAVLQGEALFNDGFGIVVFTAFAAVAAGGADLQPLPIFAQTLAEAFGGMALGAGAAFVAIRAMRAIDDYAVEVGISIALATGVYASARFFHVSGAIAVVMAGLMVGNAGLQTAMSDTTQRYLKSFWHLVDDVLNALLFLLLGLQMLIIPLDFRKAGLWVVAILLVASARVAVVLPWGSFFQRRKKQKGASLLLSWGGLHGALSLALALSLPPSPARELILSTTFAVVIVSVLVQGLSFGWLAAKFPTANSDQT
jgi:CPA1 family monovalent cation:H+ antiporter